MGNFAPEWTVDPNDPIAAAKAILRLETALNRAELLALGKNWVETQCDPVEYAKKIMNIVGFGSNELQQPNLVPLRGSKG